jgi:hypothetical protein
MNIIKRATKNVNLTTSKCLWNSTISTPHARYMCADVKKIYLNTRLDRPKYMQLVLTIIPQEIIDKYKLMGKEKMVRFTYVLTKACTDYRNQANWQTSYSLKDWHTMDTAHGSIPVVCGYTTQSPSHSHSWWMILE